MKSAVATWAVLILGSAPLFSGDPRPVGINSAGWEDSPYMTPDGQRLYFMYSVWNFYDVFLHKKPMPIRQGPLRRGYVEHPNPWLDANQYVSDRRPDGTWGEPRWVFTGCCAMTEDQKVFYLQAPGPKDENDLATLTLAPDASHSSLELLGPPVSSRWKEDNPHFNEATQTLYWTSNRPRGRGGNDLWMAKRKQSGGWERAENLGKTINTHHDEDQIWISPDGRLACFTRYLPEGPRLFYSRKQQQGWSASAPVPFAGDALPVAEASLNAEGNQMVLMVVDEARRDFVIAESHLLPDGRWSRPRPID